MSAEPLRQIETAVLDASALLRLYLADGPLPQGLEPVMERGCRGDLILPLRTMASRDLCVSAMQLSQEHSISVYDAAYLALALRHGASLFTADARLAAAARACGALP